MGQVKTASQTIPLITSTKNYPVPLTDRFGFFLEEADLEKFWLKALRQSSASKADEALLQLQRLVEVYGTPLQFENLSQFENLRTGDPRQFMSEEMTFEATLDHQIGLHAEFELDAKGEPEELKEIIEHWQEALAPLDGIYNHTRFFLAVGDMTYQTRLTLNAFTPFKNGRIGPCQIAPENRYLMVSPYHAQEKSESIEACRALLEVVQIFCLMGVEGFSAIDAARKAREKLRRILAA